MRYFLIDKVTQLEPGKRISGVKCVTLSDPILHDHFPDHPIFPGSLQIEAAAQLAGCLLEATFNKPGKGLRRALLVQVVRTKFHEPAKPGDRLEVECEMSGTLDRAAQVDVAINEGGRKIMRGTLTFVMKEIESERVHEQRRYLYSLWLADLKPSQVVL